MILCNLPAMCMWCVWWDFVLILAWNPTTIGQRGVHDHCVEGCLQGQKR